MRYKIFKIFIFLLVATKLPAQETEIDRLVKGELKMTFPSIYFKHNSTEYAPMPYTVDSCFNYITAHVKDINDLVIWRDSLETEKLTNQRIKKLKIALSKYKETRNLYIVSMGKEQKISRRTMRLSTDSTQIQYLLSLNSVFDIAKTRFLNDPPKTLAHVLRPKISCWRCWISGFHMSKSSRALRKMYRQSKKKQQASVNEEKSHRRLVWTGWKTGFHWSTAGKS